MGQSKKEFGMVQLIIVLGLITLVCALLLGMVNGVTAPQIAANSVKTRNLAMQEILPAADEFPEVAAQDDRPASITGVFEARAGGELIGYAAEVQSKGFGGAMTMIVGVNTDGNLAGVKVTGHGETPGLGAKAQSDAAWIAQYAEQPADGALRVTKDGGTIVPITGATITSRAVTLGVNTVASYISTLEGMNATVGGASAPAPVSDPALADTIAETLYDVMPGADTFHDLQLSFSAGDLAAQGMKLPGGRPLAGIAAVYDATAGGKPAGYVAEVHAQSYEAMMIALVAVSPEGMVKGVRVIQQNDGRGAGVQDNAWADQFVGSTAGVTLSTEGGRIDAVSGATGSSQTVVDIVNTAAQLYTLLG